MKQPIEVSYGQILATRESYVELLKDLKIDNEVGANNRIFTSYEILEDILPIYKDHIKINSYLSKRKVEKKILTVLMELSELGYIFSSLCSYGERNRLLAKKIKDISTGTLLLGEESAKNSLPRNTQFELALWADFRQGGLEATLEEPNPDLKLKIDGHIYNVECKRIYSPKKLKINMKKAREQLRRTLESHPKERGVIAVSITRMLQNVDDVMTPNNLMTKYEANAEAAEFINSKMMKFINDNSRLWIDDSVLQAMEVPIILMHYQSLLTGRLIGQSNISMRTLVGIKPGKDEAYDEFVGNMRNMGYNFL